MGAAAARWDLKELSAPGLAGHTDQADLDALREQELESAYRRGRAEGEEAAHARARRELASALGAARRILQDVKDAREGWDRQLEENLVALATALARHIVGRELEGDHEAYRQLVRKAASTFSADQVLRVRLHPDDLARLSHAEEGETPANAVTGGREARWIPDEEVVPGGCVVEGPDRIVDGRVDRALERLFWELTRG